MRCAASARACWIPAEEVVSQPAKKRRAKERVGTATKRNMVFMNSSLYRRPVQRATALETACPQAVGMDAACQHSLGMDARRSLPGTMACRLQPPAVCGAEV